MAVPKSRRGESAFEVVNTASKIYKMSVDICIKMPKRYTFLVLQPIVLLAGKVVKRISREAVTKERNRLRKFKRFLDSGEMTIKEIQQSFHAWLCSLTRGKSFLVCVNMIAYFNRIYEKEGGYNVPDKNTKKNRLLRRATICAKAGEWSSCPVSS